MKQLQPVIWSKGTFLTPQHLQVQDRFIEDLLQFRLQALNPFAWGFTELAVDQDRLTEGQFVLTSAAGIFPDGLLFEIPESDAAPHSRSIAEFFDPGSSSLDVYMAVPDYRHQGINITGVQRNGNTRYVAEVGTFRDENSGVSEKSIQVARKNLRLLVEGEARKGFSTLRVANVERSSAGTFQLNARFVPPLLRIHANPYLTGMLRGIVEILSANSTQLSGTRRQKNQSLADFTSADIAKFWLLYTANSYLPLLTQFFESQQVHPEEVYAALISLAGSLTTFSQKIRPRDLPPYNHDSLGPCFVELDRTLRMLLDTVVPSNVVSLPLKETQNFIYATALSDERYLANTRMYLAIAAEMPEAEIITKAPQLLKVCSATHIDHLVKQALPGLQLKHLSQPPSAIPVKLKYQYFSINQAGAAWEAIRRARNLAAYVPGDFANPQLELLILMPEST